jgi:hypothetical protein
VRDASGPEQSDKPGKSVESQRAHPKKPASMESFVSAPQWAQRTVSEARLRE